MKPVTGYHLIGPDDLQWRPSNLMKIPNADFLERTGSANTLHQHVRQEEFYFVLEGTGRIRLGGETLTVPTHGGVLVGPEQLRQVFNDTDAETLWLSSACRRNLSSRSFPKWGFGNACLTAQLHCGGRRVKLRA
jgi:oxalate decarboxylase/phosphoglucose isomerase-like protein (cupin superfamily)